MHTDLRRGAALVLALGTVDCAGASDHDPSPESDAQPVPDAGPDDVSAADVAQRIAKFIWNEPADEALGRALAEDGAGVVAREMLRDARTQQGMEAFFSWWLRLNELASESRDGATDALKAALALEPALFGAHVVLHGEGTLEQLLTASFTFADAELGRLYGAATTGNAFTKTDYPRPSRTGLFGTAGALARYAAAEQVLWPPRRFWMLSETLLCDVLSTPSPPVLGALPPPDDVSQLRGELDAVTSQPNCIVCHSFVNPVGYAFLAFDNLGRLVDEDLASANESVVVPGRDDLSFVFEGGQPGLMLALLQRPGSRACFVEHLLVYAVDRTRYSSGEGTIILRAPRPELEDTVQDLLEQFDASGGNIQALIQRIVETAVFQRGVLE